jgi:hypothetical protein
LGLVIPPFLILEMRNPRHGMRLSFWVRRAALVLSWKS